MPSTSGSLQKESELEVLRVLELSTLLRNQNEPCDSARATNARKSQAAWVKTAEKKLALGYSMTHPSPH